MDGLPKDAPSKEFTIQAQTVPKVRLNLPERALALHPLQERFVFFTPAMQYLYGGLNDAVLTDFLEDYNQEVRFYHHRFRVPLFRGLDAYNGDPSWNYVLWAVEREHWEPLVDHFCSTTLLDSHRGMVYKYAMQQVDVADPLYLQRAIVPTQIAVLEAYAFGVKTNHWVAAFDLENAHPILDPPKLRFYEADEGCKMYARALFSGGTPEEAVHEVQKEQQRGSANGFSPGNGS